MSRTKTGVMASARLRKYYAKGDTMLTEEDSKTEFKGHLNLCREEIPVWAMAKRGEKASRKPISRNINAFLNSGTGGTIFLGIPDNGKILGFGMTILQREHFVTAVEDLLSRYRPRVLPHQYSIRFTPVFNKSVTDDEIATRLDAIAKETVPEVYKDRQHVLRNSKYCWCDMDSMARQNVRNCEVQEYVVELTIHPWDPQDERNFSIGLGRYHTFQPYYSDEDGKVYFRRQASVVQYTLNTIAQISKHEVKEKYEAEIKRLQQQISELELQKAAKAREADDSSSSTSPPLPSP